MKDQNCSSCGSNDIQTDSNTGTTYCGKCGVVLDEENIVAEVSFIDNADGSSSVSGQFVSQTGGTRYRSKGIPRESRELTLEKGRKRISAVATALKLGPNLVEAAQRLYMLALQHNFVQGRRTQHVVAACLYIVCRRERTPHMLIDFSDILETNVYVLGHTFLRFCHLLNLQLPIIDPSLYIQRFAARLEFEDKTHAVATTALRIVQRMKRDWIQTGRRPAGICGASLLIAARLHGFRRTQKEIVQVVRVCDVTIRRRLKEFENTPSGALTPEEFENIDLEEECDPPAYTKGREKEKIEELRKQQEVAEKARAERIRAKKASQSSDEIQSSNVAAEEMAPAEEIEEELEQALNSEEFRQIEATAEREGADAINRPVVSGKDKDGNEETLSDIEDGEVDKYISSKEEVIIKTELWNELNKDYEKLMAERAQKAKGQATGKEEPEKPSKRKRKRGPKKAAPAETAAEAAEEMLRRKMSTKINYSALEGLFAYDAKMFDQTKTTIEKVRPVSQKTSDKRRAVRDYDDDEEVERSHRYSREQEVEEDY